MCENLSSPLPSLILRALVPSSGGNSHLSWSIHPSSGVSINQALHSDKFPLFSIFSFHLHVHTKLKHVLGSYSCNFIRYFSLILVLVRCFFSSAGFVWFFFISFCFIRFSSIFKQFNRCICFLTSFNWFNWQEMGLFILQLKFW